MTPPQYAAIRFFSGVPLLAAVLLLVAGDTIRAGLLVMGTLVVIAILTTEGVN